MSKVRRSQVECIECVMPTHYGPADRSHRRWDACVAWTWWTNAEGGDVSVSLGPHESGHMRLSIDEVRALHAVLTAVLGDEAGHE